MLSRIIFLCIKVQRTNVRSGPDIRFLQRPGNEKYGPTLKTSAVTCLNDTSLFEKINLIIASYSNYEKYLKKGDIMDSTLRMIIVFAGMGLAVLTFTTINYYQVKNIDQNIKSIIIYQAKLLPIIVCFSMVVAIAFNLGMRAFSNRVWVPFLLYLTFEVLFAAILAYAFFKEVPSKGTLVGSIMCIIGAIVAIIWK